MKGLSCEGEEDDIVHIPLGDVRLLYSKRSRGGSLGRKNEKFNFHGEREILNPLSKKLLILGKIFDFEKRVGLVVFEEGRGGKKLPPPLGVGRHWAGTRGERGRHWLLYDKEKWPYFHWQERGGGSVGSFLEERTGDRGKQLRKRVNKGT